MKDDLQLSLFFLYDTVLIEVVTLLLLMLLVLFLPCQLCRVCDGRIIVVQRIAEANIVLGIILGVGAILGESCGFGQLVHNHRRANSIAIVCAVPGTILIGKGAAASSIIEHGPTLFLGMTGYK